MRASVKIKKMFLLVFMLITYSALFSAQLSFAYDISSLEHQSKLALFQKMNSAVTYVTVNSSKHHSSKVNIRLNKRFQRVSIEFFYQNKFESQIIFNSNAFEYYDYDEPIHQAILSFFLTRGPPEI
jgi:hypothetical protein